MRNVPAKKKAGLKIIMIFMCAAVVFTGCVGDDQNGDSNGIRSTPPVEQVARIQAEFDVSIQNEEINPFVYGQFIEHIDRCIYEGLWAEMIMDRKFFYEPDDPASPWGKTGMEAGLYKEDPLNGEHSLLLGDGTGVEQRELTVQDGREYTGYFWAKALTGSPVITLSANFADSKNDFTVSEDGWVQYPFSLTSTLDSNEAQIGFAVSGGSVALDAVSLMPSDNISGMRSDTIEILKELGGTIYRWPGGNFASGYHWQDGVGDRDRRPSVRNLAWAPDASNDVNTIRASGFSSTIDPNDFGTDEFLEFCELIGTEPYICINTGNGTVAEAVNWVEYVNGDASSEYGGQRAVNGHGVPYNVEWWAVGNEMFGEWQIGHISISEYLPRHIEYVNAIRNVGGLDLKLVGVGETNENWSNQILMGAADYMDVISEHTYWPHNEDDVANASAIRNFISSKIEIHRNYRESIPVLQGKDIHIAFDEYAYNNATAPSMLRDGLGVAEALHEFFRNSDIVTMANYSSTINTTQGCIMTTKTDVMFEGSGLALKMYRNHYGKKPITMIGTTEPLDVTAAYTEDGEYVTIAVVNSTDRVMDVAIKGIPGLTEDFEAWSLTGDDPYSVNNSGDDDAIRIEEGGTYDPETGIVRIWPKTAAIYKIRVS